MISDKRVAGMPSLVLGVAGISAMHRVAVEIQPLVEHRLADAGLAVLARERAAALVGSARVEAVGEEAQSVRDGLRLEDHRIDARLDRLGLRERTALPTACSTMCWVSSFARSK